MLCDKIGRIPDDRTVTYARVVAGFWPQKKDPNRVRITVGGNLINYPHKLTTRMADLTTAKVIWNIELSTEDARFMGINIKNCYLGTPLDRYEYTKLPMHCWTLYRKVIAIRMFLIFMSSLLELSMV